MESPRYLLIFIPSLTRGKRGVVCQRRHSLNQRLPRLAYSHDFSSCCNLNQVLLHVEVRRPQQIASGITSVQIHCRIFSISTLNYSGASLATRRGALSAKYMATIIILHQLSEGIIRVVFLKDLSSLDDHYVTI